MSSWEQAVNSIAKDTDELKQRQREIKQEEWNKELPNISETRTEHQQVTDILKSHNYWDEYKSYVENIESLIYFRQKAEEQVRIIKNII